MTQVEWTGPGAIPVVAARASLPEICRWDGPQSPRVTLGLEPRALHLMVSSQWTCHSELRLAQSRPCRNPGVQSPRLKAEGDGRWGGETNQKDRFLPRCRNRSKVSPSPKADMARSSLVTSFGAY